MSELSLNEQYCLICKGFVASKHPDDGGYGYQWPNRIKGCEKWTVTALLPDYLADDAEFGRMVKALYFQEPWIQNCGPSGCLINTNTEQYEGATLQEATARACIALKLQVLNG